MGTCNYKTQDKFDLYVTTYEVDEEYIKQCEKENGHEFDGELDRQIFYEDIYMEAERLADKLNKELMFYQIEIRDGYYDGLQTIIQGTDWCDGFYNIEDMSNYDCHYYFDMCRSKAIRKHNTEVNKINKKLLPLFKKELGFEHIKCIGVFSNGEAIYERVK